VGQSTGCDKVSFEGIFSNVKPVPDLWLVLPRRGATVKPIAKSISGLSAVLLMVGLAVLGGLGCSQSPEVKKQKAVALGEKYLKDGKTNEAIIEFRNALQIDQNFVPALQGLGRAYAAKSWYGDAFRELERAQQLSPDSLPLAVDLGRAAVRIGA